MAGVNYACLVHLLLMITGHNTCIVLTSPSARPDPLLMLIYQTNLDLFTFSVQKNFKCALGHL